MSVLAERCPRLYQAVQQERALERERDRARARHATEKLKAERLVAHRDLQLLRAFALGKRRYIEHRARKLELARLEREVVDLRLAARLSELA